MHTTPERTALVRMAGRSCWRISAADEEPLQFLTILESNGLDDALWGLRSTPQDSRLFAVWCARQVQHLMTDPRSIEALDVAESGRLRGAREAAWDAAREMFIAMCKGKAPWQ